MADYTNKERQKSFEINTERERTGSIQENNVFQETRDFINTQKTGELNTLESSFSGDNILVSRESMSNALSASFQEEDKKKIKAVKEPEIIDNSEYVGLNASNIISSEDSDKMIAVKNAISDYQATKNTLASKHTLEEVIRACNQYTKGKFSLFKFGKAAQRLREVKAVREQAERELSRMAEEEKSLNAEQKETLRKDRLDSLKGAANNATQFEKARFVKNKAREFRKKYPALTKAEANKFASDAFERYDLREDTKEIEDLLEYKRKEKESTEVMEVLVNDRVKELISRDHNAFSAFFVRLFCFSSIKKEFVRAQILSLAMARGVSISDFDEAYRRNANEMLRILTGQKNINKTAIKMNRKARSDDYNNTFV